MDDLELLIRRYPRLAPCAESVRRAYECLQETYDYDGKVLACGNGGSASDAAHIVGELMKSFVRRRTVGPLAARLRELAPPEEADYLLGNLQGTLCAMSLFGEPALISAFANDVQPDLIYAQQVLGYGRAGDSLIAISTSGNSANVVHAVQVAKAVGLHTIGMTGSAGGRLKELCDVCICVPETETFMVQELHLPVYHTLCLMLEAHYFGEASHG